MKPRKYAMVIDIKKCLGCKTCTIACNTENSVLTTRTWNVVLDTIKGKYPNFERAFIPRPCMHCQEPPCVEVCPTGASYKNEQYGTVLVDHKKLLFWMLLGDTIYQSLCCSPSLFLRVKF